MRLRSTKRFFNKTFQSLRSLLTGGGGRRGGGGYRKLPKPSTLKDKQSFKELENLYKDFSNRWLDGSNESKPKNKEKNVVVMEKETMNKDHEIYNEDFMKFSKQAGPLQNIGHSAADQLKRSRSTGHEQVERSEFVKQKMKEMVLMDLSNMEHLMDIEEILFCYSQLKCPVYIEMVDKFFMELYSEFSFP